MAAATYRMSVSEGLVARHHVGTIRVVAAAMHPETLSIGGKISGR